MMYVFYSTLLLLIAGPPNRALRLPVLPPYGILVSSLLFPLLSLRVLTALISPFRNSLKLNPRRPCLIHWMQCPQSPCAPQKPYMQQLLSRTCFTCTV
ncbi:hypothetical protein BKA93DRAFT_789190, partial [Sparassis latifolia]